MNKKDVIELIIIAAFEGNEQKVIELYVEKG
jgi:hypothetical protein